MISHLSLWVDAIGTYNVNKHIQRALPPLHQLRRIMLLPLLALVLPKVPSERLLAPLAIDRVRNGRERRHGLVHAGVAEVLRITSATTIRESGERTGTHQGKRAVAAHAMAGDANPAGVQLGEGGEDGLGKLVGDVGVHVVAVVVGGFGGVDVEAGAATEVVGVVFAGDVQAACLRVLLAMLCLFVCLGY